MRLYFITILLLFTYTLSSQVIIKEIEYSGATFTKVRIQKEIPLKIGDTWDQNSKNKLLGYFESLKYLGVLENSPIGIEESYIDKDGVKLKITISERTPFFLVPLLFWSTSSLFKFKFRFFVFYINGYPIPFDGHVEFIERGWLAIALRINDVPINKDRNLSMTVNLSSYTTLLNYMIQYQNDDEVFKKYKKGDPLYPAWENGFENINFALKYTEPTTNTILYPSLGFNFKNLLKTDNSRDISTPIIYNDFKLMLNPKIDFTMPIKNTNLKLGGRVGFVYKHYYTMNKILDKERWFWDDQKKIVDKKTDIFTKESNQYLIGIANVNWDAMNGYPNPVNDDYLSNISISGMRIPFLNCYVSSYFGYAFQKYYNIDEPEKDNILFRLKPIVRFHFPLNTIMANLYVNLGFNYTGNNFIYDLDNKEYLGSVFNLSLNADDPAGNPVNIYLGFNFPKANSTLAIYSALAYHFKWYNPIGEFPAVYKNNIDNALKQVNALEYKHNIKEIDGYVTNRLEVVFWKWFKTDTSNNSFSFIDKYTYDNRDPYDNKLFINEISILFGKNIPLNENYLKSTLISDGMRAKVRNNNSFAVKFNFCFPESSQFLAAVYNNKGEYKVFPGNFALHFDLAYNLYLPLYKENVYKMRLWLFGRINGVKNYVVTGSYNDSSTLDYWFREGNASKIGYFGGFAGIIMNFEYKTQLFVVDTSRFFNKGAGKNYFWSVYWNIYLDCALSLNSTSIKIGDNRYTYDGLNNLHLSPALSVGTSFKIYPSFIPVVANLEISYNIDGNLILQRNNFASYLYIGFSFGRIDEENGNYWFKE